MSQSGVFVEALQAVELSEEWGSIVDRMEFMGDVPGFYGSGAAQSMWVTQIYDRDDGRYRPVYENETDLKMIRAACWLLAERVPMAEAWKNRLADYTIGTGFDWTIRHNDPKKQAYLKAWVKDCLDSNNWSSELERESYEREIVDGEWLAELRIIDRSVRIITRECDHLTEPANTRDLEEWLGIDIDTSWSFGVLTPRHLSEVVLGYHFVCDPAGYDWSYVKESEAIHWKRNVRAKAKRGFSDLFRPHTYLTKGDKVFTNTAEGAAVQAAIAYIVEHIEGVTKGQAANANALAWLSGRVNPQTGQPEKKRTHPAGTRLDIPHGQKYTPGMVGQNNSSIYIEVMQAAIRMAGTIHAFPEGMLTGSYQNANLASSLTAESPFVQGRVTEQLCRAERKRKMILKMLKLAAERGLLTRAGITCWEDCCDGLTVEITPSKIVSRDPLALANALEVQKRNGWVTDKTAITELGRDVDNEVANGLSQAVAPVEGEQLDTGGQWQGLTRRQWQNNRKAIVDVMNDLAAGKTTETIAKITLQSLGLPDTAIADIIGDASDGVVDNPPPVEESVKLNDRQKMLLEAWKNYP